MLYPYSAGIGRTSMRGSRRASQKAFDPRADVRNRSARKAVLGVVEPKIERGGALGELLFVLEIFLPSEPLVVGGGDVQDMSARGTVKSVLMPVARYAAAHVDGAPNVVRVSENVAIVVSAGLRESEQKDAFGIPAVLPDGKPNQLPDALVMQPD